MRAWKNVHRFFFEYFSVGILLRNFFAPFHRIQERKKPGFDIEDITETLVINLLMRIVGALVRSVFIILGLVVQVCVLLAGILFFAIVVAFPIVCFGLFLTACVTLIRSLQSI